MSEIYDDVKTVRTMGTQLKCSFCKKKISTAIGTTFHIVKQDGKHFHKACLNEKKLKEK